MSLHILDIVENSISAKASRIRIKVNEDIKRNLFTIEIKDNGEGMNEETIKKVLDPFYTTRTTPFACHSDPERSEGEESQSRQVGTQGRLRVGLGLSLLAQATKESGGSLEIESKVGKGTKVKATFQYSHIDRKPLGDMEKTLTTLIAGNPEVDFIYQHQRDNVKFKLDTKKARKDVIGDETAD